VGKVIVHCGKVAFGSFKAGILLETRIDLERRMAIARNHTATHLLQAALREVLGAHVTQQGSSVEAERLRFDFTHFEPLSRLQLDRVEAVVNNHILANHPLVVKQMELAEAKKTGALAFFADKYSGKVRVVSIAGISHEFCAGTHLSACGQIGYFKILQESSTASGTRRIEAATGSYAYKQAKEEEALLSALSSRLNVPTGNLLKTLEQYLARIKILEKSLQEQQLSSVKNSLDDILEKAEEIKGTKLITARLENLSMDLLRKNVDMLKAKITSAVIVLGSEQDDKAFLVIGLSADLCVKGLDAGKLIREVSGLIGGSGGGRGDFAQAGGTHPENLALVFEKLREMVKGEIEKS